MLNMVEIKERLLGDNIPVSIGTSVAIDSMLSKPGFLNFTEILLEKYNIDAVYINVGTLVRNILNAIDSTKYNVIQNAALPFDLKEPRDRLRRLDRHTTTNLHVQLCEALKEEVNIIHNTLAGKVKYVCFYASQYKQFDLYYPSAKLRYGRDGSPTPLQCAQKDLIDGTVELYCRHDKEVRVFRNKITGYQPYKALMLTHYAYDLLSADLFRELILIESFTGRVKENKDFSTKLGDGKLKEIPFNEATIQIFGDGEFFMSQGSKFKQFVLKVAMERKWHNRTNMVKIQTDLKRYKEYSNFKDEINIFKSSI